MLADASLLHGTVRPMQKLAHAPCGATTERRRAAVIALSVTVVAWASAFTAMRVALRDFTPEHVALLRYGTASIVFVLYAAAKRMPPPAARDIPQLAGLGLVGISMYNVALGHGQTHVAAGTASLLIASAPIWMVLMATALGRESVRGARLVGIVVSFTGVAFIAVGAGKRIAVDLHAIVLLGAAFAQAVYSIGQRRLVSRYGPLRFTAYALWSGTLFLLPFARGLGSELHTAGARSMTAVLWLGAVPSAIGYGAWAVGVARSTAATAGSALYIIPAVAIFLAWVVLAEAPTALSVGGGALVVTGVIIVNRMRSPHAGA